MNVLKSLMCAGVVGAGTLVGAPQQAEAGGGFSISVGRGYPGYYNGGFVGRGYRSGFVGRGYGGGFHQPRYYGGGSVWHDTSHYDYHPGRYVPHGNHVDYIPGHYHWHQDGHWDHYGHGHHHH